MFRAPFLRLFPGARAGKHNRALEERDSAIERWLRTEVVQAYDELEANPESAIPADAVFTSIRARIQERMERNA
jgi:antitoxin ParD1/3/4